MISTVIIGILCIIIFFLISTLIEQYLNYINDMEYILNAIDAFLRHCEAYKEELLCPDYFRCCLTYYNWFKEIKSTYKNMKGLSNYEN